MMIYTQLSLPRVTSHYYRLQVPFNTMQELRLVDTCIVDDPNLHLTAEERAKAIRASDIAAFYQPLSYGLLNGIREMGGLGPGKDREGKWRWLPSFVVDTDDNLFDITPFNPGYKDLGTRLNGVELEPGAEVCCENSEGEKVVLWKDGEQGFSVAQNRHKMAAYRAILSEAEAVTCTTPRCAEYVRRESGQKNVFVFPNCVRMSDYPDLGTVSVRKNDPSEIRILWQGSPSHYDDIEPLRHSFSYLSRRYPQVKWIFWGFLFPWVYGAIPNQRWEFIHWLSHEAYRQRLFTIGHDISLAPLAPTAFNQSRSAIKFYESSILPAPAATLAQRTGAYLDEIKDGETGLLFDGPKDFIEQASRLIEDETLRRTLGANAKDWVMENRDAHRVVPSLHQFYQELRERKRQNQPPNEIEWQAFLARSRAEEAPVSTEGAVEGADFAAQEA